MENNEPTIPDLEIAENNNPTIVQLPNLPDGTTGAVLEVTEGDVLILMSPGRLRPDHFDGIRDFVHENFGMKVLVLENGVTYGVLRGNAE